MRVDGEHPHDSVQQANEIGQNTRGLQRTPPRQKKGGKIADNEHEAAEKVVPRFCRQGVVGCVVQEAQAHAHEGPERDGDVGADFWALKAGIVVK